MTVTVPIVSPATIAPCFLLVRFLLVTAGSVGGSMIRAFIPNVIKAAFSEVTTSSETVVFRLTSWSRVLGDCQVSAAFAKLT